MRRYLLQIFFLTVMLNSMPAIAQQLKETITASDTVITKHFNSQQVVAYKYGSVTIYIDYQTFLRYTITLCKEECNNYQVARKIRSRVTNAIRKTDTVHIDQKEFVPLNWIPYDDLLTTELGKGHCLVRAANGVLHRKIILLTAYQTKGNMFLWKGIWYLVPGEKKPFLERTLVVS